MAVNRNDDGWGVAIPFDSTISKGTEYAHSITSDGKLYFSSSSDWNIHNGMETLPYGINTSQYEDGAFIAPDESYLIFESQRAGGVDGSIDLYISFRLDDNTWSMPVNMGPTINTGSTERMAKLSPDGKYLFFGSDRRPNTFGFDIYWIDAKIIDKLKNDPIAKQVIERPLGDKLISAIANGNYDEAIVLLKEWTAKYPDDIEASRTYANEVALLNVGSGKKDDPQVRPVDIYNRACSYAKGGQKDQAFALLNLAIEKGYHDTSQYENDTDLTSLKSDPRWAQLKKKLK